MRQLSELEKAWREDRPKEGGRHALNGFRFQLLCSLERLLVQVPGTNQRFAPEILADILEATGTSVIATEIKATLSSGALSHALEQLWHVERLALDRVPDLAPHLCYKIIHYRPGLDDPGAAIKRWKTDDAAGREVEFFKKKVAVERKASVLNEIAARLVNDFHVGSPFQQIDNWLGELVQAAERGALEEACEHIRVEASGFWHGAREQAPDFHVWTSGDRPPKGVVHETAETKQVLTGQRVDRRHMCEGRFAERSRYGDLHNAAETWIAGLDRTKRDRLDAFWIAGRSGSGKSVALLHLLAALHSQDNARIILWMDDQAHKIETAIKWALSMMEAGVDVIVAADDPYQSGGGLSVSSVLNSSLRLLQNRADTVSDVRMPLFVFCGPPEQQEVFAADAADDLDIESYHLPRERTEDIVELKEWYFKRTGKTRLPTEGEGVLLVQIFFEWQMNQPIAAFAKRLGERLKAMMSGADGLASIFDLIARILAMRRLYVNYPSGALEAAFIANPTLERAFAQLARSDHHFEIVPKQGEIRFTHPHLADAIYRAWFGRPTDGPFHGNHLASGIDAWWTFGSDAAQRVKPLWAIEGLLAVTRREDWEVLTPRWQLIADVARPALEQAYRRQVANMEEKTAYLPVWARLEDRLDLALMPPARPSLAEAVDVHVASETLAVRGLPLACRTLIQLAPDSASPLLNSVRQLLNGHPYWAYWPSVALKHARRFGLDAVIVGARAFVDQRHSEAYSFILQASAHREAPPSDLERQLVINWLRLETERKGGSQLRAFPIVNYLRLFGMDDDIRPFADAFLAHAQADDYWSACWELLWELDAPGRPALATRGFAWLRTFISGAIGWEFVFEHLIRYATDGWPRLARLLATGRRWLLSQPDDEAWSRVWDLVWPLLEQSHRARLQTFARQWLRMIERRGWSYVWRYLWSDGGRDADELRRMGLEFLEAKQTDTSWSWVWQPMWDDPERDTDELRRLAMNFLGADQVHPGWARVWEAMWADPQMDRTCLRRLALLFLGGDVAHSSWTWVWAPMWEDPERDAEELRRLGLDFLEAEKSHSAWARVWTLMWADPERDAEELRRLATEFLEADKAHSGWTRVWEPLWSDLDRDAKGLRRLGLEFLEADKTHSAWTRVWEPLWADSERDAAELRRLGLEVLEADKSQFGWSRVWQPLWADSERDAAELRRLGLEFLEADKSHFGWSWVWEPLWADAEMDRVRLRHLALQFLQGDKCHSRWTWIWGIMWEDPESDAEELRSLGREFLEADKSHPGWTRVWVPLWETGWRAELRDVALDWLDGDGVSSGWPLVWNRLWDSGLSDRSTLRGLVDALAARAPPKSSNPVGSRLAGEAITANCRKDYSWSDAWEQRWNLAVDVEREDLVAEAHIWLEQIASGSGGRSKIWLCLWNYGELQSADRRRLANLALRWLDAASFEHKRWPDVWAELWDYYSEGSEREILTRSGRLFAETALIGEPYLRVWERLFALPNGREALIDVIRDRRRQATAEVKDRIDSLFS